MTSYYFAPKPENATWPDNWKKIVTMAIDKMGDREKEKWKAAPTHVFSETVRVLVQEQFIKEWKEIKTIDIQTREWRDKTYGNTYFSSRVTLDYGMPTERGFTIPFQYGYGGASSEVIKKLFPDTWISLRMICQERGIILRENTSQVKKRDAEQWGKCEFMNPI